MSLPLTRQRCTIHLEREAAARCPSCERFFCRECVTEHDGRLLCALCLRELFAAAHRPDPARGVWRKKLRAAGRAGALVGSALLAWLFFHMLGRNLAALPDEFHVDKIWNQAAGVPTNDDD